MSFDDSPDRRNLVGFGVDIFAFSVAQALYCECRIPEMPEKDSSAAAALAPYRVAHSQRDYQMRREDNCSSGSITPNVFTSPIITGTRSRGRVDTGLLSRDIYMYISIYNKMERIVVNLVAARRGRVVPERKSPGVRPQHAALLPLTRGRGTRGS